MPQSPAAMSIDKMIHSHDKQGPFYGTAKKTGKVKVFYSFKDSDSTCLSSFGMVLPFTQNYERWIPISLKQCLVNVCSSCPDQLMHSDYDTAIYSANIEESNIGQHESLKDVRATVIWEGHGLLSNLLRDQTNDHVTVTGQLSEAISESFDYAVQVLLQLRPVRRSPQPSESFPTEHYQYQQQRPHSLPSMKSLFASENIAYPPYPSSLSPPGYQQYHEQQSSHTTRATGFRSIANNQLPVHCGLDFIPPLTSSPSSHSLPQHEQDWPGYMNATPHSHDEQTHSRLTPSLPISHIPHHHQHNSPPSHFSFDLPRSSSSSSVTPPPAPTPSSPPITMSVGTTSTSGPSSSAKTRKTSAFYHQSRKKKRDTKPPNASDIRPFVEVDRDLNGQYIFPVEVDSWTVIDLGSVVWDRVAFHNQRYIYPVGYRVKKWYRSMIDPHSDTQYTCHILDGGDEPIFQLEADDNPGEVWRGPTPTTVWTIAVRRAFAIRNMDYGHNPVGPDFFGLRKNTIAKMIQDLPNADKCKNYIWQNFEATTNTTGTKNKAVRRPNARVNTNNSIGESAFTPVNYTMASSTSVLQSTHSRISPLHPMSTSPA